MVQLLEGESIYMADIEKERTVIVNTDSQEKKELTTHQLLEKSLEQQNSFFEKFDGVLQEFHENKRKDKWDVLSSLSGPFTICSSIIIAFAGIYFTNTYKGQEVRITEAQTVEKFLPSLNNAESRKGALLAVYGLQDLELAARLAASYAAPDNIEACEVILKTVKEGDARQQLIDALVDALKRRVETERESNTSRVDLQELIGNSNRIFELRDAAYIRQKRGDWYLASIYTDRGNLYRDLKKYAEASADYKRALDTYPEFAYTFENIGLMHAAQDSFELAIENIKTAIEKYPSIALYYADLGGVYAKMANREKDAKTKKRYVDEAEIQYIKAVEKDPSNLWYLRVLGSFYLENGMRDKAENAFYFIVNVTKDDAEATIAGYHLYKLGYRNSGTTSPEAENRDSASSPQATPTPRQSSKGSSNNRVQGRRPIRQRRR